MNALIESSCDTATGPVPEAVWPAVRQMLGSPLFARAPRMCHLLSFLVDKKLTGKEREITEYAIGLDVFRRDARLYGTLIDPVVRVQVGRLRGRLAAYYAAARTGSYIPSIGHAGATAPAPIAVAQPARGLPHPRGAGRLSERSRAP